MEEEEGNRSSGIARAKEDRQKERETHRARRMGGASGHAPRILFIRLSSKPSPLGCLARCLFSLPARRVDGSPINCSVRFPAAASCPRTHSRTPPHGTEARKGGGRFSADVPFFQMGANRKRDPRWRDTGYEKKNCQSSSSNASEGGGPLRRSVYPACANANSGRR